MRIKITEARRYVELHKINRRTEREPTFEENLLQLDHNCTLEIRAMVGIQKFCTGFFIRLRYL